MNAVQASMDTRQSATKIGPHPQQAVCTRRMMGANRCAVRASSAMPSPTRERPSYSEPNSIANPADPRPGQVLIEECGDAAIQADCDIGIGNHMCETCQWQEFELLAGAKE